MRTRRLHHGHEFWLNGWGGRGGLREPSTTHPSHLLRRRARVFISGRCWDCWLVFMLRGRLQWDAEQMSQYSCFWNIENLKVSEISETLAILRKHAFPCEFSIRTWAIGAC